LTTLPQGRIFLSYRRADSRYATRSIYDRLVVHFGEDAVFMDVDTIQAGLDFVDVLQREVQSCDVLVAVMGQRWLNIKDEEGNRRLENPEDFVRIEIATALERDIRVIPVLLDGVMMPRSTELPENLKMLARRNALQVKHDSFGSDLYRLTKQLELALRAAEDSKAMKARALTEKEAHAQRQDEIEELLTQADLAISLKSWQLAHECLKEILSLDAKHVQAQNKLNIVQRKISEVEAERKRKESREKEKAEEERRKKAPTEKARQDRLTREKQIAEEKARQDAQKKAQKQERTEKSKLFFSGMGKLPIYIIGGIALLFLLGYSIKNAFVPVSPEPTRPPVTEAPATATLILATSTFVPTATEKPTEIPSTPAPMLGVGSTMISEKDGMTLLYVPAGEFEMGGEQYDSGKPIHTVYLDAYWIDQTEVTNEMYAKCVSAGNCGEPRSIKSHTRDSYYGNSEFNDYPVMYVSWHDANDYCTWAKRRLPTEAEWEKAVGWNEDTQSQMLYPWGSEIDENYANYAQYVGDTTLVGSYEKGKSFYGAYDMAGNLSEWVDDWFAAYPGNTIASPSYYGYGTTYRVLRGGSWYDLESGLRSATRRRDSPTYSNDSYGFRCSRSP